MLLAGRLISRRWLRLAGLAFVLPISAARLIPLDEAGYAELLRPRRGKVVLVDFWATWCEPCREELPKLVAVSNKLDRAKFTLLTISADEPEQESAAASLLKKVGLRSPGYIKHTDDDQAFINSVDRNWSGALPALFLYDACGRRIRSFIGDSDVAEIENAIRKAVR